MHFEPIEEKPVENKNFFKIELKPIEPIPSTEYAIDRRAAERANIDREIEDRKYVFHEPPRYHYNGYPGDCSPGNLPYDRLGYRQTPER